MIRLTSIPNRWICALVLCLLPFEAACFEPPFQSAPNEDRNWQVAAARAGQVTTTWSTVSRSGQARAGVPHRVPVIGLAGQSGAIFSIQQVGRVAPVRSALPPAACSVAPPSGRSPPLLSLACA